MGFRQRAEIDMFSGMSDVSIPPAAAARTCRCAGEWRHVGALSLLERVPPSEIVLRLSLHIVGLCWSAVVEGCPVAENGCTARSEYCEGIRCTYGCRIACADTLDGFPGFPGRGLLLGVF